MRGYMKCRKRIRERSVSVRLTYYQADQWVRVFERQATEIRQACGEIGGLRAARAVEVLMAKLREKVVVEDVRRQAIAGLSPISVRKKLLFP